MNNLTIINKRMLSPDIVELTLTSRRPLFRWRAGQYAALGLVVDGREQWRCFSMTNVPNGENLIQFGIKIGGNFTKSLARLEIGDTVKIQGPFGEFVIDAELDKQIVMLAGGIGVTPLMAMMRDAVQAQDRPLALLYSFRSLDDSAYVSEIIELKKQNPQLSTYFFTDNKGDLTVDTHGEILTNDFIGEKYLAPFIGGNFSQATYFLCGPPPFIAAMADVLANHGIPNYRVIREDFTDAIFGSKSNSEKQISRWVYGIAAAAIVVGIGGLAIMPGLKNWIHNREAEEHATSQNFNNEGNSSSNSGSNSNSNSNSDQTQTQPNYVQPRTRVS
jgi:ferredoxin-NADP reductase